MFVPKTGGGEDPKLRSRNEFGFAKSMVCAQDRYYFECVELMIQSLFLLIVWGVIVYGGNFCGDIVCSVVVYVVSASCVPRCGVLY